ncbi:MAG: VCBS repeat-containing protein [Phycisphaerales bacterium]|nr:VCBS repeat-containing protein [Phycisphaerales bacterium]
MAAWTASALAAPTIELTNVTSEAQLVAVHAPDALGIPAGQAWMTGGMAVGDFDRDGRPDLFVVGGGLAPDRLYMNQGDGTFTDVAAAWGIAAMHCGCGASAADYDGDGWIDLYVTSFGAPGGGGQIGTHRLYRNTGAGSFENVAAAAGVNQTSTAVSTGYSSAWGDYDLDGDLDLFVASWWAAGSGNRLFRNDGDGTFTDVTATAIGSAASNVWGFTPAFVDMDGDLYPEILLAADFNSSRYLVNDGDGTFTDATASSGTGLDGHGMGQTVGDFNNDGRLDWFVTSIHNDTPPPGYINDNKLYIATDAHQFVEQGTSAGVFDGGWGWGTIAVDLDQDRLIDIVEVNGRVSAQWGGEPAKVWRNIGGVVFEEIGAAAGIGPGFNGTAVAMFDYDADLDQDFVMFTNTGPLHVRRNDTVDPGHAIVLSFDTSTNPLLAPDGIGVRVEVVTGDVTQIRYLSGSPSYLATSELTVHVGLGDATAADVVRVTWTRGQVTEWTNVAADQAYVVVAPILPDITADGVVNGADLSALLAAWGPVVDGGQLKADLDDNGAVDHRDLARVLASWSR